MARTPKSHPHGESLEVMTVESSRSFMRTPIYPLSLLMLGKASRAAVDILCIPFAQGLEHFPCLCALKANVFGRTLKSGVDILNSLRCEKL